MSEASEPFALNKSSIPLKVIGCLSLALIVLVLIGPHVTLYMQWATLAYLFMVMGLTFRKQRKTHVRFMGTSIFLDLALVLLLEFNRNAVKTALEFSLGPLQQMHIAFSTLAVLCYIPVLYLGIKRLRNRGTAKTRSRHIQIGAVAFIFRTLGFVLMFSLLYK